MLLRRYVPALIASATLLVAIVLAPSRPAPSTLQQYADPFAASPGATTGGVLGGAPVAGAPAGAGGAGQVAGSPTGTGTTTAGAAGVVASAGPKAGGPAVPAGDTKHCVAGKQFGGMLTAPPCQPRWTGGDNGGATYRGVTKDTVDIVYYREADNAVVKSYAQAYDFYSDPADQQKLADAAESFANSHYEFWGRKVKVHFVQSPNGCTPSPPDDACYRNDARAIVAQYKPFAVFYENDTNAPGFFDELSKQGVVNWGGWHFSDSFNTSRRPYHYDIYTGGDAQAEMFGKWYCTRLANHNARYAGDATLKGKPRKAGILVQNIDLNVAPAQHLAQVINSCDKSGAQVFTYDPDTGRSQQQSVTLVSQMKNAGVTSVLYFCDPIAPQFFTGQQTSQGWNAENIVVGSGLIDYDPLAQTYDTTAWSRAFGISDIGDARNVAQTDAQTMWKAAGGAGTIYKNANNPWSYFASIFTGIQQAGPHLDPGSFEKGMLSVPVVPGSRFQPRVQYGPGDYTGVSDYREVYWDGSLTSVYNAKAGAYRSIGNGRRWTSGTSPQGELVLPGR